MVCPDVTNITTHPNWPERVISKDKASLRAQLVTHVRGDRKLLRRGERARLWDLEEQQAGDGGAKAAGPGHGGCQVTAAERRCWSLSQKGP